MQTQGSTTPTEQAQVQPRFCRHCSKPIKPWNESGYCADHCYIGYRKKSRVSKSPRSCAHCGKILGPQNKHGTYCTAHRLPSDRAEKRFCEFAGVAVTGTRWGLSRPCSSAKPLRADNQTGRCLAHRDLVPSTKRRLCTLCKTNRLGNANKSGFCRDCRKKTPLGEQDRVAAKKRTAEYQAAYRARLREKEAKADRISATADADERHILDLRTKMQALEQELTSTRAELAAAEAAQLTKAAPDPRITLAVCLELQGIVPYNMRDQLFPDVKRAKASEQRTARHDRVKKLLSRGRDEFERERKRIAPLSSSERVAEAKNARLRIPVSAN